MDLDQVLDDRHLPDAGTDPTSGGGGWGRALLRRGWAVGRKAAVAGAAVTAAPVVGPPLLLLSAVGFVLSFPFAAYLASLAAADRLMGSLFPLSPGEGCYCNDQEDVEDEFLEAYDYDKPAEEFGQEAAPMQVSAITLTSPDTNEVSLRGICDVSGSPVRATAQKDKNGEGIMPVEEGEDIVAAKDDASGAMDLTALQNDASVDFMMAKRNFAEEDSTNEAKVDTVVEGEKSSGIGEGLSVEVACPESNEGVLPSHTDVLQLPVQILPNDRSAVANEESGVFAEKEGKKNSGVGEQLNVQVYNSEQVDYSESKKELPASAIDILELPGPVSEDKENAALNNEGILEVTEEVMSEDSFVEEVMDIQMDVIAPAPPESEEVPLSDIGAFELPVAAEIPNHGVVMESRAIEEHVVSAGPTGADGVEHQEGIVHSFISAAPDAIVHDPERVRSSGSSPYVSALCDEMTDVESRSDSDHPGEARIGDVMPAAEFENIALSEDQENHTYQRRLMSTPQAPFAPEEDFYSEERLREQLVAIRTITGYKAVPGLTLAGELAGLYLFTGVEPPVTTKDASSLIELNEKLRFLKLIVGVK